MKLREGNVFTSVCDSVHVGVPGLRGVWSRGCLVLGGAWPGGSSLGVPGARGFGSGGVPGADPPGRLLLQAVHILLECILVIQRNYKYRKPVCRLRCIRVNIFNARAN